MKLSPFFKFKRSSLCLVHPAITSHHEPLQSSSRLHSQNHNSNILGPGPVSSRWSLLFSFPKQNAESVFCFPVGIMYYKIHTQWLSRLGLSFIYLFNYFSCFRSVLPDERRDSPSTLGGIISFHILFISLFIIHFFDPI